MKKTMKKTLALAMAVAMGASLSLSALALDQSINHEEKESNYKSGYTIKNASKKLDTPVKINDDYYPLPLGNVFEGNLNTVVDVSGMEQYAVNLLDKNADGSYDLGIGGMDIAANLDWTGINTDVDDAMIEAYIKSAACKKDYEAASKVEFPTFQSFVDMILESDADTIYGNGVTLAFKGFDVGSVLKFTKPGTYLIHASAGSTPLVQPVETFHSILIISGEAKAAPSTAKVIINGEEVSFDAYTINGNNYFKLRDVAQALNGSEKQFEVGYDPAKNAISLTSAKPYTSVGGELAAGDGKEKTAFAATAAIFKDGLEASVAAYSIGGNNYFKLRDLGEGFNFGIGWDAATSSITIDTKAAYVAA